MNIYAAPLQKFMKTTFFFAFQLVPNQKIIMGRDRDSNPNTSIYNGDSNKTPIFGQIFGIRDAGRSIN